MPTVTIEEAQAQLPRLIEQLARGEEIIITCNALPVAKLVAAPNIPQCRPQAGLGKGMLTIISDDDDHLEDFAEYM